MKLFVMQFSPISFFGPNILLNTLFSNTLSLCSSLNVRDHVSLPYRTTGKVIVLHILAFVLKDYRLIVERRFASPSDPESYAGGSVSSWLGHPCQTSQRVGARRSVVSGTPNRVLGVGLTVPDMKNNSRTNGGSQNPHRVVAPVKNNIF
jgi:hypothetical protein